MSLIDLVLQVWNLVQQIFNLAKQIVNLVNDIWSAVVQGDMIKLINDINGLLHEVADATTDPVCNLETICAELAVIDGKVTALGAPQQTGSPVTLPTTPPSAYIAPTSAANASGVWGTVSADTGTTMGTIMAIQSAYWRFARDSISFAGQYTEGFRYNFDWPGLVNNGFSSLTPFSVETILPTHLNRLDWLNDQYPSQTWNTLGDGTIWTPFTGGHAQAFLTLTEGEFEVLRMLAGGPLAPGYPRVPPTFPGIANVTLLTSHAIAGGGTITAAMDGCIVAITSFPSARGFFTFGSTKSLRNAGALSFFTDDGEQEQFQYLGFLSAVLMPKNMEHAGGLTWESSTGIDGTITPFTIN